MSQVAKLFTNGRSQAVRLPASCRFKGKEVFVRHNKKTGEVILSPKSENWDDFLAILKKHQNAVPKDFLSRKERGRRVSKRDPFVGWKE